MGYARLQQRLLGLAFVAGPLLLLTSAAILVAGVGRNPGAAEYGSKVEGVIGFFGFVLMVPVFLSLASRLGDSHPRLAAVAAVVALLGFAGGGVMNMVLRVFTGDLVAIGVPTATLDALHANFASGQSPAGILLLTGPLAPLASILVGVGFVLARHWRAMGWLLLAGGVLLPMGQLLLIATDILYTMALALWTAALLPMGLRLLRSPGDTAATSPQRNLAPT